MGPKDCIIEFNKVTLGHNEYEFIIDDSFLQEFEYSPIKRANVKVSLDLFRSENMYDLKFKLQGVAMVDCDVCTENIGMPIASEFELIMKVSDLSANEEEDVVYLAKKDIKYDLKQFLYENFLTSVPIRKSCDGIPEPKPCNMEVLKKLGLLSKAEDEENSDSESGEGDSRWSKLNQLFNNN